MNMPRERTWYVVDGNVDEPYKNLSSAYAAACALSLKLRTSISVQEYLSNMPMISNSSVLVSVTPN
jgi:hypothetical protein